MALYLKKVMTQFVFYSPPNSVFLEVNISCSPVEICYKPNPAFHNLVR